MVSTMYYDLIDIEFLGDYRLELTFADGKKGLVDIRNYIKRGGVFARLSDMEFFHRAYIDKAWGVLCWPDGIDIAPENLYTEATGQPLPSWVQPNEDHNKRTVNPNTLSDA